MKDISSKIGKMLCLTLSVGGSLVGLSSCDDFFDVKPLNEIVLENYWTEKSDVTSVVASCYSGMMTRDFLERLFLWGDVRSEDVVYNTSGNKNDLRMIVEENILETNPYLSWESYYQVINRCNTVIHYAPEVAALDPNYTEAEMKANVAEAIWIRSYCYFVLARTFRDVPYKTEPSIDDTNVQRDYVLKPTSFKEMLKQLTSDVEAVQNDVLRYYPPFRDGNNYMNNANNTSRITTCAMYALLADLYLWQNEYEKCLEYTQKALDYKLNLYNQMLIEYPDYVTDINLVQDKYPLIYDKLPNSATAGNAYSAIFGSGNSFESIFELYFTSTDQRTSNPFRTKYNNDPCFLYFSTSDKGIFNAYTELTNGVYSGKNSFFNYTDNRVAEYFETTETQVVIKKFAYSRITIKPSTSKGTEAVPDPDEGDSYQNWLIYRLSDILLMRAEALTEIGGDENLKEAFNIISAIYNRANNLNEGESLCLKADKYTNQEAMRQLVLDERHRELMFEGKRWFDQIRFALRQGSNENLITAVTAKQKKNANKISIQLQSQDALFWPYAKRELELNSNLSQNAAYITNETSQK